MKNFEQRHDKEKGAYIKALLWPRVGSFKKKNDWGGQMQVLKDSE